MNWDAVAAIGEMVGALAVVLTLYYLAIQARSAKDVALAQAQRELAVGLNSVWSRLEQDRELLRLVRIGVNDWQALENNEKAAIHALFSQLFANFSAAIGPQHLKGNEDFVRTWEDVLLGILLSPGGKVWWDEAHYLYGVALSSVGKLTEVVKRPSGISVGRMTVPIGLVGFIYESRPNVTVDAAGITLKAGNAILLRGGKEALHSNIMLAGILNDVGVANGIPEATF